jgi:hypothetical protein
MLTAEGATALSSIWPPPASKEIQCVSCVIVEDDGNDDDEEESPHSQAHTSPGAVDRGSITRTSAPLEAAGTDTLTHTRQDEESLLAWAAQAVEVVPE